MKNNLSTIAVFNKTTLRSLLQFARAYMSGRVSFKNILFLSRDSFPPSLST